MILSSINLIIVIISLASPPTTVSPTLPLLNLAHLDQRLILKALGYNLIIELPWVRLLEWALDKYGGDGSGDILFRLWSIILDTRRVNYLTLFIFRVWGRSLGGLVEEKGIHFWLMWPVSHLIKWIVWNFLKYCFCCKKISLPNLFFKKLNFEEFFKWIHLETFSIIFDDFH